jgi:hypothetical protein
MRYVVRALSVRLLGTAMFAGFIVSIPFGFIWQPLQLAVIVIVGAVAWVALLLDDDFTLYCPECKKRVKMWADRCHHCGASAKPEKAATTGEA